MSERFPNIIAKEDLEEISNSDFESANDPRFNVPGNNYVIEDITKKTTPSFSIATGDQDTIIIADDEFAKAPVFKRLTREDFDFKAIQEARLEAQSVAHTTYAYTEKIVADEEFAKHRLLTRKDFTEDEIIKARDKASGTITKNTTPTRRYTDFHTLGRINVNQEVPPSINNLAEPAETEPEAITTPKYNITIRESSKKKPIEEYKRTGNLINPNATRLTRKDFPKGPPMPLPTPKEIVTIQKPNFFKNLIPKFIKRFFH
jgi:hypothetical protein